MPLTKASMTVSKRDDQREGQRGHGGRLPAHGEVAEVVAQRHFSQQQERRQQHSRDGGENQDRQRRRSTCMIASGHLGKDLGHFDVAGGPGRQGCCPAGRCPCRCRCPTRRRSTGTYIELISPTGNLMPPSTWLTSSRSGRRWPGPPGCRPKGPRPAPAGESGGGESPAP